MREALALAARGAGRTHPNPAVGALVVRDGAVVGRGFHRGPGNPHAEVEALREAGALARGSELLVTLEPCCTWGRTPPCTDAVREAGVRRVVAGCRDPNPAVSGRGFKALATAEIAIREGLLRGECRAADVGYHHFYERGRPFVHLKWAQTLDGRAERPGGGYLTGPEARAEVHRERSLADGLLVSAGTVLSDNPRLTVREGYGPKPLLRVILDRRGRIRGGEKVFATMDQGAVWVVRPVSTASAPFRGPAGSEVKTVGVRPDGGWDLRAVLDLLTAERVMVLYVEAVGRLSAQFLAEELADRLSVHLAPFYLGAGGIPALGGPLPEHLRPDLREGRWERHGRDWTVNLDLGGGEPVGGGEKCSRG